LIQHKIIGLYQLFLLFQRRHALTAYDQREGQSSAYAPYSFYRGGNIGHVVSGLT
jgi:hypothetical protein